MTSEDFFFGTRYTDKVLGQIKQGDFHSFPENVRAMQDAGVRSFVRGADGQLREMLRIPGQFRGRQGMFEFIKDADGMINHRYFRQVNR